MHEFNIVKTKSYNFKIKLEDDHGLESHREKNKSGELISKFRVKQN